MEHPTTQAIVPAIVSRATPDNIVDRVTRDRLFLQLARFAEAVYEAGPGAPITQAMCDTAFDVRFALTVLHSAPQDAIFAKGDWTGGSPGNGHFIWRGRVSRQNIPILSRWFDPATGKYVKDAPVHRVLWLLMRADDLAGRPRRMAICDEMLCANPYHFEESVPMQVAGRPEFSHAMRTRRWAGGVRRPIYYGTNEVREGTRVAVCSVCYTPLGFSYRDADAYIGKQVYCSRCEAEDRDVRARQGLAGPKRRGVPKGYVIYNGKPILETTYQALVKDPFDTRNPTPDDVDEDALLNMFPSPAEDVDNAT